MESNIDNRVLKWGMIGCAGSNNGWIGEADGYRDTLSGGGISGIPSSAWTWVSV